MKQKIFSTSIIAVIFTIISSMNILSEEAISPEKSEEIINQARTKTIAYNKKYRGIEYLRTEVIKEYDPSNDKLLSTSNLVISRREYIYEKPEYTVIKYKKDGKEMKPSDYKEQPSLPVYQIFDEKGKDRYNVSIVGYVTVEGIKCYKIKVTPKQATERHLDAYIYSTIKDLLPVMCDMTIGKLSFPLKEASMQCFMSKKEDYDFIREFTLSYNIKVLFFYNRKFIITGRTIEAKPIKL